MDFLLKNFSEFVNQFKQKSEQEKVDFRLGSFITPIGKLNLLGVVNRLTHNSEKYFYWSIPERGYSILGVGNVLSYRINGPDRIKETEQLVNQISKCTYSNKSKFNIEDLPMIMGGLKFSHSDSGEKWSDYSDSDWIIPDYLIVNKGDIFYLVYNFKIFDLENSASQLTEIYRIINQSDPVYSQGSQIRIHLKNNIDKDISFWEKGVKDALEKIQSGLFHKIVLSRCAEADLSARPDIQKILFALAEKYPRCYIFAYKSADSIFFGASPEKLIRISQNLVEADALAGSIARGDNEIDDLTLADELLNSDKNLAEQKAVVDFISHSFESFADNIEFPEKPVIRKLDNIQHLWTPVKANLKKGISILSVLDNIHPTPAICGTPCNAAISSINNLENYPRGMYAGVIGWFNFDCEGEFAVGIRTGLIKKNKLYAFAGCGIVEGSDPQQEYEEAELKMIPILSLFENEN